MISWVWWILVDMDDGCFDGFSRIWVLVVIESVSEMKGRWDSQIDDDSNLNFFSRWSKWVESEDWKSAVISISYDSSLYRSIRIASIKSPTVLQPVSANCIVSQQDPGVVLFIMRILTRNGHTAGMKLFKSWLRLNAPKDCILSFNICWDNQDLIDSMPTVSSSLNQELKSFMPAVSLWVITTSRHNYYDHLCIFFKQVMFFPGLYKLIFLCQSQVFSVNYGTNCS